MPDSTWAAVFVYYLVVVLHARAKTPAIVREALRPEAVDLQLDNSDWRYNRE